MDSIDTVDTAALPRIAFRKKSSQVRGFWYIAVSWLRTWEMYPILAIALFLHLYQLSTSQFDADQAILFRLPRMAMTQGWIPATGTVASIGMVNPPGYVYLLMPIAALTASPWADIIFTALLNVAAVILTYVFTRRYYGRVAGTVAALLYTTTFWDLYYGRFIWQPNLLPFFTLLFMLALFRGAVEHKPGWFVAALPLLGFMLQLHATPTYMLFPLFLTLLLAYKTLRWREVVVGLLLFCLFFATYFIWEAAVNFADLRILLAASGGLSKVDNQAFTYYLNFLVPYVGLPHNPQSLLFHFVSVLHWESRAMYAVTLGGFLLAVAGLLGWKKIQLMSATRFPEETIPVARHDRPSIWGRLWRGWLVFVASPQRRGLLLLLAWQIPPVLLMSRHTISLQPQYFLILLPGPFILIGLLFSQVTGWCGQIREYGRLLRFAVPALSLLLVALQFTGSFAWFTDEARGNNYHGHVYDTWQDVQGAVNTADQLAQSRHLHHVYIDTDLYTLETLKYLAGQMHTPVTVLSSSNCLILPALSSGPAVMLLGPADTLDLALLNHFASVTLVSEPARLGGPPFQLYIVRPLSATPSSQVSFTRTLTPSAKRPGTFVWNNPDHPDQPATRLFETTWTNLRTLPAAYSTMYTYDFAAHYSGNGTGGETGTTSCGFSSLAPGEQLLVPFRLPAGSTKFPTSFELTGSTWISQPDTLSYGPFHFESILDKHYRLDAFQSTSGGTSLLVQN